MRDASPVSQLVDHPSALLVVPASLKVIVTLHKHLQGAHALACSDTQQSLCLSSSDRQAGHDLLFAAFPTLRHGLCCRGGPSEIIVDGVSGFQIDPFRGEQAADTMADFFEKVCGLSSFSYCSGCS